MRRRFAITVTEGRSSVNIVVNAAERIGAEWVWVEDPPEIDLLPTTETEWKAVLKDALVALIERL